jgi:hypothetical protein
VPGRFGGRTKEQSIVRLFKLLAKKRLILTKGCFLTKNLEKQALIVFQKYTLNGKTVEKCPAGVCKMHTLQTNFDGCLKRYYPR